MKKSRKRKRNKDSSSGESSSSESEEGIKTFSHHRQRKKRKKQIGFPKNNEIDVVLVSSSSEEQEEENQEKKKPEVITIEESEDEIEEDFSRGSTPQINNNRYTPPLKSRSEMKNSKVKRPTIIRRKKRRKKGRKRNRKLVIKPFEIKKPPSDLFEKNWTNLHNAIKCIFNKEKFLQGYEPLYQSVQNLVIYKHSEELYRKLRDTTRKYIEETLKPMLMEEVPSLDHLSSLKRFRAEWDTFIKQIDDIRQIFLPLDRCYIYKQQDFEFRSIQHMTLTQFREAVLPARTRIREKLLSSLFHFIEEDREGRLGGSESRNIHTCCRRVVMIFFELDLSGMFEKKLLEQTRKYFEISSQRMFSQNQGNLSYYLKQLEKHVIKKERLRMELFGYRLHRNSTPRKILRIIYDYYLKRYTPVLLEVAFEEFFKLIMNDQTSAGQIGSNENRDSSNRIRVTKDEQDLRRLYLFLKKLTKEIGLEKMRERYEKKIENLCEGLIRDYRLLLKKPRTPLTPMTPATPQTPVPMEDEEKTRDMMKYVSDRYFVEELMILTLRLRRMERACFLRDKIFALCIRSMYSRSLNQTQNLSNRISILLSKQIHSILSVKKDSPVNVSPQTRPMERLLVDINSTHTIEQQLRLILKIFQYLDTKDFFEESYKAYLAQRLIMNLSRSADEERLMVNLLKQECGTHFTSQLDGMFKDLVISRELTRDFNRRRDEFIENLEKDEEETEEGEKKKRMVDEEEEEEEVKTTKKKKKKKKKKKNYSKCPFKYSVVILKKGDFPKGIGSEGFGSEKESQLDVMDRMFIYPQLVSYENRLFENFYVDRHSGRKLEWKASLSQCHLRAHYRAGSKEFVCSAAQASVLLGFNEYLNITARRSNQNNHINNNNNNNDQVGFKKLTFNEIKKITGIDGRMLRKTVSSLSVRNCKILLSKKSDQNPSFEHRLFKVNPKFQHKRSKIKVNMIQIRMISVKDRVIEEKTLLSREAVIDAAVVRIMKARKELTHERLTRETLEQVLRKFKPTVKDIKKRIESLIDRDYIKRGDDNKSYVYIA